MATILVVDDHAIIREPVETVLRRTGHTTVAAQNGAEALVALSRPPLPDLVLLDLAMPVLDGLAVLRAMRADPRTRHMPVVVLSALGDKARVVEVAQLGVHGYLLKSQFSLQQLLSLVQTALTRSDASDVSPQGNGAEPRASTAEPLSDAVGAPAAAAGGDASKSSSPESGRLTVDRTKANEAQIDPNAHPCDPTGKPLDETSAPAEALRALKPIVTRSEMAERLDKCGELRGFSPAVAEVLKLTSNARCSIEQVAKAIARDHAVALKILKLANSAVYTRGEPVDSVPKAVLRIGMGQIRQAVLNIAVIDRFSAKDVDERISAAQFWEHGIATGLIAAMIAEGREGGGEKAADAAFTMGLLHDAGRMVCIDQLDDTYRTVLDTARRLQLPLDQVEQRMLCYNHADIMDRVLRAWRFPKEFINPVVFHHLSAGNIRKAAPQDAPEVATLALANRLAHALMLGSSGNETIYPTEDLCELLNLPAASMERIERTARDETDKVKFALLAQSNQVNWPQLREVHREELARPLRPMFVSSSPAFDAHRIFCDQLATRSSDATLGGEAEQDAMRFDAAGTTREQPPNLGVIAFRSVRERVTLSERYRAREAEANASNLPILALSPGGQVMPENSLMAGRRVVALSAPFAIPRFIAAVRVLLDGEASTATPPAMAA